MGNYLSDRILAYDATDGPRKNTTTAGEAQSSILGPDLWNVAYDDIFQMAMPENSFLVGYAVDIATVIVARDTAEAQLRINVEIRWVESWMGIMVLPHNL